MDPVLLEELKVEEADLHPIDSVTTGVGRLGSERSWSISHELSSVGRL